MEFGGFVLLNEHVRVENPSTILWLALADLHTLGFWRFGETTGIGSIKIPAHSFLSVTAAYIIFIACVAFYRCLALQYKVWILFGHQSLNSPAPEAVEPPHNSELWHQTHIFFLVSHQMRYEFVPRDQSSFLGESYVGLTGQIYDFIVPTSPSPPQEFVTMRELTQVTLTPHFFVPAPHTHCQRTTVADPTFTGI